MRPGWLAVLAGSLAFVGVNASYLVSAFGEQAPWCVPYLEGCISISKAGRQTPAIYVYWASIIPSAALMAVYWWLNVRWLAALGHGPGLLPRLIGITGIVASASLILYALVLGSSEPELKLVRRYGALLFFVGTGLAQLLLTERIFRLRARASNAFPAAALWAKAALALALLAFGWASTVITYYDIGSLQNVIEWNVAALMAAYFVLTASLWRATDFSIGGAARSA